MEKNGKDRKVALITGITGQVWSQHTYKGLMFVAVDLIFLRKVEKLYILTFIINKTNVILLRGQLTEVGKTVS